MIIYEVNLEVNTNRYHEFYSWLTKHINEMMTFKGFLGHIISSEKKTTSDVYEYLTVSYYLDTKDSLDDYINNNSQAMRDDGINKFGDSFSATRRVHYIKNVEISNMITHLNGATLAEATE